MISVRRLIASMLAGALLVLVSAAQASAQPDPGLSLALEGVGRGLEAAAAVAGEGDVVVVDEGLIEALGVYDAWLAKHEDSNRQGEGQGPANAQAVHEGLLEREVPGQLKKQDSKLSGLSGVYEVLKGKSDEAKKIKEDKAAKDETNNGKSEDAKSNNGKSEDARSNVDKSDDAKSDDDSSEDDD